jgi:hypothetical protein
MPKRKPQEIWVNRVWRWACCKNNSQFSPCLCQYTLGRMWILESPCHMALGLCWVLGELWLYYISKMSFSRWEPPGVSELVWSLHLVASISGDHHTPAEHSGWPSESLATMMTGAGQPWEELW